MRRHSTAASALTASTSFIVLVVTHAGALPLFLIYATQGSSEYSVDVLDSVQLLSEAGVETQCQLEGEELILAEDPSQWRQRTFQAYNSYGFVKFSRRGGHLVAAVNSQRLVLHAKGVTPVVFYLYNVGPVSAEALAAVREYVEAGQVDVTDFRKGGSFDAWMQSNEVVSLHLAGSTARWVLVQDLDEFLEFMYGAAAMLASTLTRHADKAFLTHCAVWLDSQRCNKKAGKGLWGAERMVLRTSQPYCYANPEFKDLNYCLEWHGLRKHIFQPQHMRTLAGSCPDLPVP
eukprot:jgi/Mesen1/1900/ME000143S00954